MHEANTYVDLVPNASLGHYTIVEHIADGGMGHVFRGFEPSLQREVAIKVLKKEANSMIKPFPISDKKFGQGFAEIKNGRNKAGLSDFATMKQTAQSWEHQKSKSFDLERQKDGKQQR
ncbi:MAG: hypothetical protein AAF558_14590, partial [Verrucomicrobiota bacterium]